MSEVIRGGAQAQSEATSETPKFTPGPWVVSKTWEFGPISDSDDQSYGMMVSVGDVFGENRAANASLIKASPDLYEALSELISSLDDLISDSQGVYGLHLNGDLAPWSELVEGGCYEDWLKSLEAARAALRKAEGGE